MQSLIYASTKHASAYGAFNPADLASVILQIQQGIPFVGSYSIEKGEVLIGGELATLRDALSMCLKPEVAKRKLPRKFRTKTGKTPAGLYEGQTFGSLVEVIEKALTVSVRVDCLDTADLSRLDRNKNRLALVQSIGGKVTAKTADLIASRKDEIGKYFDLGSKFADLDPKVHEALIHCSASMQVTSDDLKLAKISGQSINAVIKKALKTVDDAEQALADFLDSVSVISTDISDRLEKAGIDLEKEKMIDVKFNQFFRFPVDGKDEDQFNWSFVKWWSLADCPVDYGKLREVWNDHNMQNDANRKDPGKVLKLVIAWRAIV